MNGYFRELTVILFFRSPAAILSRAQGLAKKFREDVCLKQLAAIPLPDMITPDYAKLSNKDWRLRHEREPAFDEFIDQFIEAADLPETNENVNFGMRAFMTALSSFPKKARGIIMFFRIVFELIKAFFIYKLSQ